MAVALLTGLGVALILEGLAYALFPDGMKRLAALLQDAPSDNLRFAGLALAALGLAGVWLVLR